MLAASDLVADRRKPVQVPGVDTHQTERSKKTHNESKRTKEADVILYAEQSPAGELNQVESFLSKNSDWASINICFMSFVLNRVRLSQYH